MKLGIVDTMFSRVDMGAIAMDELKKEYPEVIIIRKTVPGVKDLAVECKRLLDSDCDSCLALGMVGGAPIDTQCGHEASLGIQQAKLLTGKHIVEVFVHENEAWSEREFLEICNNRVRKHAHNAVLLVKDPARLIANAGKGIRQGKEDEGGLSDGSEGAEKPIRLAIIVAKFNEDITTEMEKVALETIKKGGHKNKIELEIVHVPGVFDIPLVARKKLMDKRIDGAVALGAVIKGETGHDEAIAKDAVRRLGDISAEFRKPVTLGIIGPGASRDAAKERAKPYASHAIRSAVYLVRLLKDGVEGKMEMEERHKGKQEKNPRK